MTGVSKSTIERYFHNDRGQQEHYRAVLPQWPGSARALSSGTSTMTGVSKSTIERYFHNDRGQQEHYRAVLPQWPGSARALSSGTSTMTGVSKSIIERYFHNDRGQQEHYRAVLPQWPGSARALSSGTSTMTGVSKSTIERYFHNDRGQQEHYRAVLPQWPGSARALSSGTSTMTGVSKSTIERYFHNDRGQQEHYWAVLPQWPGSARALLSGTSTMTEVSKSTIERLMKRDKTTEEKSELPRTKRVQLDEFDLEVLRRTVNPMNSERKILPTLSNIQTAMQEDIGYRGSKNILRKYMRQLGFTYRKSQTNRKLLMERGDVVLSRIQFQRKICQLREAGCNIVYTDETYVHSNHTETWQDGDVGANVPFSRGRNAASRVCFFNWQFVLQCRSLPEFKLSF